MPLRVDRTPRARADLLDIWDYVATDSEPAADRLIERIGRTFDLLADQPYAGRGRPEMDFPNLRSLTVGNYVVFYVPSAEAITVIRVLEGHRDLSAAFLA